MLRESHEMGVLPKCVRDGVIIVIHKKDDAREVRNYRPITLLNLDYKIMSKMLVARMTSAMDEIISSPQLGFVPGRVITEATHLVKLAQALADEEDADGLLVAADWEKAFDRVSWDYLHNAMRELGFGPQFRGWIEMMYNEYSPPTRRVRVNGVLSEPFTIRSGTPQGCPASPLIFLCVAEALTRMVMEETKLHGVRVGGRTVKLSQFADDTQFFLRGYGELTHMWKIINKYETATGMRANKKKFEAIRLGRTRREPVPDTADTRPVRFITGRATMKLLGVPFWEGEQHENDFWEGKYNDVKSKMVCWKDHAGLTQFGRGMLANAMVLSRYRYWAQSMRVPGHIMDAILSDVQALIWQRDVIFTAGTTGSELTSKRFMKAESQFGDRKSQLGLGALDWASHVTALQAKWILKYRDATRGEWKGLLDAWYARHETKRGAPFTTIAMKKLTMSTTQREGRLPGFWRDALKAIRSFTLVKADPRRWDADDARAHPVWDSPLFAINNKALAAVWKRLELRTVKDMFLPDGKDFTQADILSYFDKEYYSALDGGYWVLGKLWKPAAIISDWRKIRDAIPKGLKQAIHDSTSPDSNNLWRYSAQSVALMHKMGWRDGGLGRHRDGIAEPLSHGRPRPQQLGLGHSSARKALAMAPPALDVPIRWKRPNPCQTRKDDPPTAGLQGRRKPAAAVDKLRVVHVTHRSWTTPGTRYGYLDARTAEMRVVNITTKGKEQPTPDKLDVDPEHLERVTRWNGGVVERASTMFPKPSEWRLEGIDKPLDMVEVKDMTKAISARHHVEPSCLAAWRKRIGELPLDIGHRYNLSLLTPRDWASHFKNVLHRAMWVKGHNAVDKVCRCCGLTEENLTHLATCEKLQPTFAALARMAASRGVSSLQNYDGLSEVEKQRWALFALAPGNYRVPSGWTNLHLLLWKQVVYGLTIVETEDEEFMPHKVWQAAWWRFERKTLAKQVGAQTVRLRAESRGDAKPDLTKRGLPMDPIASLTAAGEVEWDDELVEEIKKLGTPPPAKKKNNKK